MAEIHIYAGAKAIVEDWLAGEWQRVEVVTSNAEWAQTARAGDEMVLVRGEDGEVFAWPYRELKLGLKVKADAMLAHKE